VKLTLTTYCEVTTLHTLNKMLLSKNQKVPRVVPRSVLSILSDQMVMPLTNTRY